MSTPESNQRTPETDQTKCCIAGGGPAGIMLGLLLARAGVEVLVLEKHKDFFRDFRGDTIHPSTLEVIHELGFLDEFLKQPHQVVRGIEAHFGDRIIHVADFTRLPVKCPYIALMPQWDFLNFLSDYARRYPGFRLRMEAEVTDVLWENDRVIGVKARTANGELHVRSTLVVGADGRSSTVRQSAKLEVIDFGAPIDVLWFRVTKRKTDPPQSFGFIQPGQFMVLIDRDEYWQCAYVIRKGGFPKKQEAGLDAFRAEIARCTPFLESRMEELKTWDDVKLLTVKVDRLRTWARDGLLCIGDSAHAMSPVGGVGINLAIQDAVAAARLLGDKLRTDQLTTADLHAVQQRRELPTKVTQGGQVFIHKNFLEHIFKATKPIDPPWPMRLLEAFPFLRQFPARMVGVGARPEHVV
jgi:2-polyprenyl-6-methoxyphenol hydroxylase-like FAD-dependent oxidoreductase